MPITHGKIQKGILCLGDNDSARCTRELKCEVDGERGRTAELGLKERDRRPQGRRDRARPKARDRRVVSCQT